MTARACWVTMSTATRRAVAQPGGLVVSVGFYLVVTAVLSSLWHTAAVAHGGSIAGYSAVALVWYIATTEASVTSLNIRLIEEIGTDIATGAVAVELLRPVSSLAIRVAAEVGRALPRLAVAALAGSALASALGGAPPDPSALMLAGPALLVGATINLVTQHAFASAAFWVRDARSAWFLYQKLVFVLGGMLLPLEVLPPGLEHVARWLPFMAMAYVPARLASGHFEPELLLVQVGWLVVMAVVAVVVFNAGERRLQVVGG